MTSSVPDNITNALIVAQNALAGYVTLSNGPDTEEHHQLALHAFDTVQTAIRQAGILKPQLAVEGPNWREKIIQMPRRAHQGDGTPPRGGAA